MEKLFENKTTYNKDTYLMFLKFHAKTYNLTYILYTVFWIALLLLCIYLSFSNNSRIQGVILTIALLVFIFYRFYHPKMLVKKDLESDKISDNNINDFTFFSKNFTIQNKNGSFYYRYFMLRKVFETEDFFYLYVTKENAFILDKSTFSLGTTEEFSKFIKDKCKLKYKKKLS